MKYLTLIMGALMALVCGAIAQTNGVPVTDLPATGNTNLLVDASVIIGGIMIIGALAKHAFPDFPNRFIPLITWGLGVVGYLIKSGDTSGNGILTAILVAASATGLHSGVKNLLEKSDGAKLVTPLLLGFLMLTGCKSPTVTKGVVRTTVATGVGFGVLKSPTAIPYLRASAPVVCSAAHGTNIAPVEVIAALEGSDARFLKTPEGTLIMNGALSLYMTLFDEYGASIKNLPLLQSYLEGVCEGINLGLPVTTQPAAIAEGNYVKPHVQ